MTISNGFGDWKIVRLHEKTKENKREVLRSTHSAYYSESLE